MSTIFRTVADDVLHFGRGNEFNPRKVVDWLDLDSNAVSRIAAVAPSSVRYDDSIPRPVRERLEELANTVNLVAQAFDGDAEKAAIWFRTPNPMLGGIEPKEMVRLGRGSRLSKFILTAMSENVPSSRSGRSEAQAG